MTFWHWSGSLDPYTELRIRILLFLAMSLKMPTKNKFFLLISWCSRYINISLHWKHVTEKSQNTRYHGLSFTDPDVEPRYPKTTDPKDQYPEHCTTRVNNIQRHKIPLRRRYCCKMKEVGGWDVQRIFYLPTSKARCVLEVVLPHLWRVNVKTNGGFMNNLLADLSHTVQICAIIILRYCTVGRTRQYHIFLFDTLEDKRNKVLL
jgi:hypothetical protein